MTYQSHSFKTTALLTNFCPSPEQDHEPTGSQTLEPRDSMARSELTSNYVTRQVHLFAQPPHDPILTAAGAFIAPFYELTGNGYGLANAPLVWFKRVLKKMTESNFHQHSLDRCFFIHYSYIINCAVIVNVDDFNAVYSSQFDLTILENMFSWGKTIKVTEDTPCEYRGKEIRLVKEGNKYMYRITQSTFIENMEGGHLPTGRLQKDAKLTPSEIARFPISVRKFAMAWRTIEARCERNCITLSSRQRHRYH